MFSVSPLWINGASPSVDKGTILSQSPRLRRAVVLPGHGRPLLTRAAAWKNGLVYTTTPYQMQVIVPEPVQSAEPSPQHIDEEDCDTKPSYEC